MLETIAADFNAANPHAGELVGLKMDVTDRESIRAAARKVAERDDKINMLVCHDGNRRF